MAIALGMGDPTAFASVARPESSLYVALLVVLFVGADVLILAVWNARRRLRRRERVTEPAEATS